MQYLPSTRPHLGSTLLRVKIGPLELSDFCHDAGVIKFSCSVDGTSLQLGRLVWWVRLGLWASELIMCALLGTRLVLSMITVNPYSNPRRSKHLCFHPVYADENVDLTGQLEMQRQIREEQCRACRGHQSTSRRPDGRVNA